MESDKKQVGYELSIIRKAIEGVGAKISVEAVDQDQYIQNGIPKIIMGELEGEIGKTKITVILTREI